MIGKIPGAPTNYQVDGMVTAIDMQRQVCKVICFDGRMLSNVGWSQPFGGTGRSAMTYSPIPRERVRVKFDAKGNACIERSLQIPAFSRTDIQYIGPVQELNNEYFYRRYNASMMGSSSSAGNSKPEDQIPGDFSISKGGSIFAITNSGSILSKASSMAQIFITKIDDLVRVVSRNYQQFSEAAKKVQDNVRGRIYQYHAWYHTRQSSVEDKPEYWEAIGDVAAAEFTKGELVEDITSAQTDILYKAQVDEEGVRRFTRTLSVTGEETLTHTSADGLTTSHFVGTEEGWDLTIQSSSGNVELSLSKEGVVKIKGTDLLDIDFPRVIISNSNEIDLGNNASESIILGEKFASWLESILITWAMTHTHVGNLGAPTSTPIQPLVAGDASLASASSGSGIYSSTVKGTS